MAEFLVLNGPNLNLLGTREPDQYGHRGLDEIMDQARSFIEDCGHGFSHLQSNAEHELVEAVHRAAADGVDGVVLNPAALTHTSVALRDALLATGIPFIEVHLSNTAARESFRQHSYFSDIALGTIAGFRGDSYLLALQALVNQGSPGQSPQSISNS